MFWTKSPIQIINEVDDEFDMCWDEVSESLILEQFIVDSGLDENVFTELVKKIAKEQKDYEISLSTYPDMDTISKG